MRALAWARRGTDDDDGVACGAWSLGACVLMDQPRGKPKAPTSR